MMPAFKSRAIVSSNKEQTMRNNIRSFIIGGFLTSGLGALALTIPFTLNIPFSFSAGSPIKASEINANFERLKTAVESLENTKPQTDDTLKGNGASTDKLGIKLPLVLDANGNGNPILTAVNRGTGGALYAQSLGQFEGIKGESSNYIGVIGLSSSATANIAGVKGINSSGSGQVVGVSGEALFSPIGTGVVENGTVTGGYFEAKGGQSGGLNPTGVYGIAKGSFGTGVYGSGHTWGGRFSSGSVALQAEGTGGGTGITSSTQGSGSTLVLTQSGTGRLISGNLPSGSFYVLNNGDITTSGDVISKGVILTSDRNAKTNFTSVNALEVLGKVTHLPISRWNYKTDSSSLQHVGPMAQDFHAAFGLNGLDDKHLSAVDVQGVALAAIQGLNQKLEQKTAQINDLETKLAALEQRLNSLEHKEVPR
jgi:hypothetical protein